MSSKLSITLRIAERSYPVEVDMPEEARLRAVGKHINQQLRHYKETYGTQDSQDLLAIYAVDASMNNLNLQEQLDACQQALLSRLNALESLIDEALDANPMRHSSASSE